MFQSLGALSRLLTWRLNWQLLAPHLDATLQDGCLQILRRSASPNFGTVFAAFKVAEIFRISFLMQILCKLYRFQAYVRFAISDISHNW